MKRVTSFVRNFHFGNTVKFMANETKEFIIYSAECMRAYFGINATRKTADEKLRTGK